MDGLAHKTFRDDPSKLRFPLEGWFRPFLGMDAVRPPLHPNPFGCEYESFKLSFEQLYYSQIFVSFDIIRIAFLF
jgi:hypothetical protein